MCHSCIQPRLCSVPNIGSHLEAVVLQGGKPEESLQDLACSVTVRTANLYFGLEKKSTPI